MPESIGRATELEVVGVFFVLRPANVHCSRNDAQQWHLARTWKEPVRTDRSLDPPINSRLEEEKPVSTVSMVVNGNAVGGEVEGRTLLVDFLRQRLRLTGTHVGCDTSQCGACVVHVNGKSVKSCTLLALECEGAQVTTIEGLASNGNLHPLQEAFFENHGLQCGFCTPGMIMSSLDLLQRNKNPSEAEIREWLVGNLCRCTGYHNIVKAVQAAAKSMGG